MSTPAMAPKTSPEASAKTRQSNTKPKTPKTSKNKIAPARSVLENEADSAANALNIKPIGVGSAPASNLQEGVGVSEALDGRIEQAKKRTGHALPTELRSKLETHFNRDLSSVQIHDDAESASLARDIQARAFTTGDHIYFAAGQYQPETPAGEWLITHETAHIIHQRGEHLHRKVLQRDGSNNTVPETEPGDTWSDDGYSIDFSGNKPHYTVPELVLPKINGKKKGMDTFTGTSFGGLMAPDPSVELTYRERDTNQGTVWSSNAQVTADKVKNTQRAFVGLEIENGPGTPDNPFYMLRPKKQRSSARSPIFLLGTTADIAQLNEANKPTWDKSGNPNTLFHIDHYREWQLGGEDDISNMWLLEQGVNVWSGGYIKRKTLNPVKEAIAKADRAHFFRMGNATKKKTGITSLKQLDARVTYLRVTTGESRHNTPIWTKEDVTGGKQFNAMESLTLRQARNAGLAFGGSQGLFLWKLRENASWHKKISQNAETGQLNWSGKNIVETMESSESSGLIKNFQIEQAAFNQPAEGASEITDATPDGAIVGYVTGHAFVKKYKWKDAEGNAQQARMVFVPDTLSMNIIYKKLANGIGYFILDTRAVEARLRTLRADLRAQSGMTFESATLSDNWSLNAGATVQSTHPLFSGWEFSLEFIDDAILVNAKIDPERLNFGIFRVTEANLMLGYDVNKGFIYGGNAFFELEGLGSGEAVATNDLLEASFNFDTDLFDPASVQVKYENRKWLAMADLGLANGKVPFVTAGNAHFEISEENGFSFSGGATLQIPGIPGPVEITISYSQETHELSIGGFVQLDTSQIPGVTGASATIIVTYNSQENKWDFSASGNATFDIRGVTGGLGIAINNNAVIFRGNGRVEFGDAAGSLSFVATNMPVDENGEPVLDGDPLEELLIFGSGEVSITFGDYLTGTAGIEYTPEGAIILDGEIALPPTVELFPERNYDKELLDFPRVEFPIFGITIPVVGSIGVFGFIGGGLNAKMTVGPGELRDTSVNITYMLGNPDSAEITGESHFVFASYAGLELEIGGGLGLGAAIADLTGEVGITAEMGAAFEGGADLNVAWTPVTGLQVNAAIFARGTPRFEVGVYARAAASVALMGEVWSETWREQLASFGSDMAIEARLPASWDEENGIDLSLDNLEFTYPDIDIEDLASGVMDQVVG